MGRLSKFLFVQEETNELADIEESYMDPLPEVNIENVTTDNLLDDIYKQNNLADYSHSIFKVKEVISAMPKEMTDATKKETVLTILKSFGLTAESVCEDGRERIKLIEVACESINEENSDIIAQNNLAINKKKEEIQALEKDNAEKRAIIDNTKDTVSQEVEEIQYLIGFIGG